MTLIEYLSAHKLTPADFAGRVGKPVSTITRLLKGERKPGFDLLQEIAKATNGDVRPDDFFDLPRPAKPAGENPPEAA